MWRGIGEKQRCRIGVSEFWSGGAEVWRCGGSRSLEFRSFRAEVQRFGGAEVAEVWRGGPKKVGDAGEL